MKMHALGKRICAAALLLSLLPLWKTAALAEDETLIDEGRLDRWMADFVREHQLDRDYQRFSVGFCYTGTGESWYYDADQWMYSASLYKVPVSMLVAEKEAAGELGHEDKVLGMPLSYWESTALTYSNNDSGHALVDYLGGTYLGKCSDMTIRYTTLPESYFVEDFFQTSYYTARYMTQVMQTLCAGGEEQFPHVIEYLLPAQPDGYLNRSLKDRFPVAQKYGSYEEPNGNKNEHIAAIVYTPTPIIVTVMTRNIGAYQDRMAEIGAYLADYALELDALAEQRRAEREATPPPEEPEATAAPAETPTEAPQSGEIGQTLPALAETPEPDGKPGGLRWLFPAVLGALVLMLALTLVSASARRRRQERERAAMRARARRQRREAEAADGGAEKQSYVPKH